MNREYHKWWSLRLGREMELLVFGSGGVPVVAFPCSQGRFFEFEDRGLIGAVAHKIERGEIQLICLDSVDAESWYNRKVPPRWRIARHVQYEQYVMDEVLPLVRQRNGNSNLVSLGCSFGGYHAANIALRHPDHFTGFLSMSGAFDMSKRFLGDYYDDDVYFHTPSAFLSNLSDAWYYERLRRGTYVLATGWDDHCLGDNKHLARVMGEKGIPHRLDIWDTWNSHDWPTWARMMNGISLA